MLHSAGGGGGDGDGRDAAGLLLLHIYINLAKPAATTASPSDKEILFEFAT